MGFESFWWKGLPSIPTNTGRSLLMQASPVRHLKRTNSAAAPTDIQKSTFSVWLRPTLVANTIGTVFNGGTTNIQILDLDPTNLQLGWWKGGVGLQWRVMVNCFDPTEWLHYLQVWDGAQAVATDRLKIYLNGVQVTQFQGGSPPAPTATDLYWAQASAPQQFGTYIGSPTIYQYLGYMHYPVFVDGQLLTAADFGYTDPTGKWMPKQYLGGVGVHGFVLDFSDDSNIGKDLSGNGDFAVTGFTPADIYTENPRLNYPLLPMDGAILGAVTMDVSRLFQSGQTTQRDATFSHLLTSGRWYWEVTPSAAQATNATVLLGICEAKAAKGKATGLLPNGQYQDATGAQGAYGAAWTAGETIGIDLDLDSGTRTIRFYVGGVWGPTRNIDMTVTTWQPLCRTQGLAAQKLVANFGTSPLNGAVKPAGTRDLNSANLPSIIDPSLYFGVLQWTGTGAAQAVGGLNFTPDMIWIKHRNAAEAMMVQNSARGVGKHLLTNSTAGEVTDATTLTGFIAGGVNLGASVLTNKAGDPYIAFCWKKAAAAGFDIVSYNGDGAGARALAHALGVVPAVVIIKRLDATAALWPVYMADVGAGSYYAMNTATAVVADATVYPTAPTNAAINLGNSALVNAAGVPYVAFVFAPVLGLSKFDVIPGAGGAEIDGTSTLFRPGLTIRKPVGATNWIVWDNRRLAPAGAQWINWLNNAAAEISDGNAQSFAGGQQHPSAGAGNNYYWAWGVKLYRNTRATLPGN